MSVSPPLITLTTDFGDADSYVAQMKGVIAGINREAGVIDVTHRIPPQDLRRAAAVVDELAAVFPEGSIHVIVVDPGVGSERSIVAVEMAGQRFVAPDNGVLSLVALRRPPDRVVRLTDKRFWRRDVSHTFHGRDIMAPVAANWSKGHDVSEFGDETKAPLVSFELPVAEQSPDRIAGEVLWADAFGNLITNIEDAMLPSSDRGRLAVQVGASTIRGVSSYYSARSPGEVLALVGSSHRLEIAVNQGNAAERLAASVGTRVTVELSTDESP